MFRSMATREGGLDAVLDRLPPEFRSHATSGGTVVVGPTGVFLVRTASDDVRAVAEGLGRAAARLRTTLSRHLPWTPFVDALVVAERLGPPTSAASVVPERMLRDTLLSGPQLLSPESVERISALVAEEVKV